MNNKQFKKGQEVWVKVNVVDHIPDTEGEIHLGTCNDWDFWLKPEDIMTEIQEKPVIPKFVADWIKYSKTTFVPLIGSVCFDGLYTANYANWSRDKVKLISWMSNEESQEIFAKAWLFDYEVKQENLYYVSIPNAYHGDFGYSKEYDNYSFYNKNDATAIRFELTEAEIKEHIGWALKEGFAKEVK